MDLTINTALALPGAPVQTFQGEAGAAVTIMQPVYRNPSLGQWLPALASGNVMQSGNNGLALALSQAQAAGQPITLLKFGNVTVGATLTVGQTYVVSNNAGKIAPITDLTSNSFVSILFVATNTVNGETPQAGPFCPGVAKA